MSHHRRSLREALGLVVCAAILGLAYTFIQGKGVFAQSSETPLPSLAAATPVMVQLPEAMNLYESGTALFIDARHEFDFKLGHIKGAVNIPLTEFDQKTVQLQSLPKDKVLVTYCDGIQCNSSIELATKLHAAGFINVKIFFAGWNEWNEQGLPTEIQQP